MDAQGILKKIKLSEKQQDYTYGIIFLLLSSFFIFFIIRPVLSIALSLRREKADLIKVEKQLEENFNKALSLQTVLQQNREGLVYLNDSLPNKPAVMDAVRIVEKILQEEDLNLSEIRIDKIVLKSTKSSSPSASPFSFQINVPVSSEKARIIYRKLTSYRRLLSIERMSYQKGTDDHGNLGMFISAFHWQ